MPDNDPPFHKWRELDQEQKAADPTRHEDAPQGTAQGTLPVKMWMLRFAWVVSTGMLILGALLIILILSGHGEIIGL